MFQQVPPFPYHPCLPHAIYDHKRVDLTLVHNYTPGFKFDKIIRVCRKNLLKSRRILFAQFADKKLLVMVIRITALIVCGVNMLT